MENKGNNGSVGMLVDLDRCTGCQACVTACKHTNNLPIGYRWLDVIRNKPEEIDGRLVMDSIPIPLAVDKCAAHVAIEDPPPCAKVCMGRAILVGPIEKLAKEMEKRRAVLFTQGSSKLQEGLLPSYS